ncbi:MAG TPA: CBS domain-containing protein [Euryarchaeota archaeon]|nr:CBS domain-containing protein [Euryarchaeota archaeon]
MRYSIKIIKILGIPIELHITFILLLAFVVFTSLILGNIGITIYIVMIFTLVLFHEISHSVVAMHYGVKITKIVLLPIGGLASMSEIPRDAKKEFFIAIAGPAMNFAAAFVSVILIIALGMYSRIFPLFSFEITGPADLLLIFFKLNLILGFFNLFVPAIPMDGGRVFRSLLSLKFGFKRATVVSTELAKVIAIFMALFGLFLPNIWLIVIAFFVYIGATQEGEFASISSMLSGLKVRDIMSTGYITVPSGITLAEFFEIEFRHRHLGYPVMENDKIVGVISFSDLSKVPKEKWDDVRVRDIMSSNVITIDAEEDAIKALTKMSKFKIGRLIVLDGSEAVGIISKTDLIRAIELKRLQI